MVIAKKYVYDKPFEGMPNEENFKIVEEELPELQNGEYLAEAVFLSVDPYMRTLNTFLKQGDLMIGSQVAKIIESKSKKFPVGKYVVASFGWRTHTISREGDKSSTSGWDFPTLVPFEADVPISLALGTLGMPGNTAYFGFLEICKPKRGETVVISGAAGAVGSTVGQIARIKECKVIGITGSEKKEAWLNRLGFDHVINYKKQDLAKAIAVAAPNGIDCFFDNVGGEASSVILDKMNTYGRVAVCGAIASYNDDELPRATIVQRPLVNKQIEMRGFLPYQWQSKWNEGILQNLKWIQEGKLQYRETVTKGFDNMVKGLIGVFKGENIGKAVVKV